MLLHRVVHKPHFWSSIDQILRYGAVGIVSTLLHIIIASAFLLFNSSSALEANFFGFFGAFFWSFFGNFYWVFRFQGRVMVALPRYLTLALFAFVLSSFVSLLADAMKFSPVWSLGMIILAVPSISYLTSRFWVFKASNSSEKQ